MPKIICVLLLSSLSFNVLANPYEQLGSAFNDLIDVLAKKNIDNEYDNNDNEYENKQVNYSNIGSFTYGSDGSSYYNTNDRSYGNNGNNYYQMNDNMGYDSNGSTYQRVGNYIYINNPDGSRSTCYVSDVGTQCR